MATPLAAIRPAAAPTLRRVEPSSGFAPLTGGGSRVLDVKRVPTQLSLFSRVPASTIRSPRTTD